MHRHHHRNRGRLTPVQAILIVVLAAVVLGAAYYFGIKTEEGNRNPDPIGDAEARHAYDVSI